MEDKSVATNNAHDPAHDLSRRNFMQSLGGGVVILFSATAPKAGFAQEQPKQQPKGKPAGGGFGMGGPPPDLNAYLRIGEDGKVTVFSGKIEQGQGNTTALAQMAAEELCVSLASVTMVMGDTALCPWDMGTFGSMSVRVFGAQLRSAAAEARTILLEMAAEWLSVPPVQLQIDDGVISAVDKSKTVTFAELAKGQKITRALEGKAVTHTLAEFSVMGRDAVRVDAVAKVTGAAKFTADYSFPGMLHAKIVRPPAHGAKLKAADASEAEKMPGVTVVREPDLVAALAADPEVATAARAKIKVEYELSSGAAPETVDEKTIFDHLLGNLPKPQIPANEKSGDLAEGEKASAEVFEHSWRNGYGAHAPMEPHAALAKPEGDGMTMYISTQTPFPAQNQVAGLLKLPPEKVRVIAPFVGGGFGGKSSGDQSNEAARLAKATGKPVLVAYTREEEFFYDAFRPAAIVKIKSGVDAGGKLTLWSYDVYYAGNRSAEMFYDAPHKQQQVYGGPMSFGPNAHPFQTGSWRAPGANLNNFARESQIDVMAAKLKADPLDFRLKNTSDKRARAVLEAAAERFGYKPAPAPSGRGIGIACGIDAGSYVAEIAQVALDAKGAVVVKKVVAAQDMGVVVNPAGAKMQMEGCIMMGLGYTLSEELRFKGGRILTTNFHDYKLPRFSWLPEIDAFPIKHDDLEPQGGGEPAICPIGAAVANALFDLEGVRLHEMPFTPERIKAARKG
ncbi:MAG: molybdopterin-dependent oxidoreductase [Acidobacteriota bacterium]|jgi:isoquinoline 1-oxidoreductase|nr:molybdopterin-dependent oxidoreductase [Acidobacteriota bacterium]